MDVNFLTNNIFLVLRGFWIKIRFYPQAVR